MLQSGQHALECVTPAATVSAASPQLSKGLVLGLSNPGGDTDFLDTSFGELVCDRFLAVARNKPWWQTPEWGRTAAELPSETQFLLTQQAEGGPYVVYLPLIDSGRFRATLRPSRDTQDSRDTIVLRVESGCPTVRASSWEGLLYIEAGSDPFALVDSAVATAAALSGTARPRTAKEAPASLDLFGWCTWDAFYSKVSAKGIQEGLESLHAGGVAPRFLIIDDGWQRTAVDPCHKAPAAPPATAPTPAPQHDHLHRLTPADAGSMGAMDEEASQKLSAGASSSRRPRINISAHSEQVAVEQGGAAVGVEVRERSEETAAAEAGELQVGALAAVGGERAAEKAAAKTSVTAAAQRPASRLAALLLWVPSLLLRLKSAILLALRSWAEKSAPGSWIVRFFSAAVSGPLRRSYLRTFAAHDHQPHHAQRLTAVEANAKFAKEEADPEWILKDDPADLAAVVAAWKERFGLRLVYCWHALAGYWNGVSVGHPAYASRQTIPAPSPGILEVLPGMAWDLKLLQGMGVVPEPEALHQDMHAYLAASGVDGVKVDVQATVGMLGRGFGGGPAITAKYHAALEGSIRQHFPGNHAINCMCLSTENIYRWEHTALSRVSDDFYPRQDANPRPHVAMCAYSTLFLAPLVWPDWDMFHSRHPAALMHATARVISGGPVYVSDAPGRHDFALLKRLVLPDGSLLRPLLPGRPTRDCLFVDVNRDGRSLLKVWNANRFSGMVAAFNLQGASWDRQTHAFLFHDDSPPALSATVVPADCEVLGGVLARVEAGGAAPQAVAEAEFAAFSEEDGRVTLLAPDGGLTVRLEPGSSDIITLAPVLRCGPAKVAAIGLANMLNPGGAVTSLELGPAAHSSPHSLTVGLRGSGTFLAFADAAPTACRLNGMPARFEFRSERSTLEVAVPEAPELHSSLQLEF